MISLGKISLCLLVVVALVQGDCDFCGPFEITADTLPSIFFFFSVFLFLFFSFPFFFHFTSFQRLSHSPPSPPPTTTGYVGPNPFPFKTSTGYVVVNEEFQRNNFYWLTESSSPNPDQDPLVFWYTGGPGSFLSSSFFFLPLFLPPPFFFFFFSFFIFCNFPFH